SGSSAMVVAFFCASAMKATLPRAGRLHRPAAALRERCLRAEGAAAAAGRLHVRVVELEPGAVQTLDVVDLGPEEVHEAHLVTDELDPLDLQWTVAVLGLVEVEVVGEARAAAALDLQAKRIALLDVLFTADLFDLFRGLVAQRHHGRLLLLLRGGGAFLR